MYVDIIMDLVCFSSYFAEQLWSKYQDPPCAHELSRDRHYWIRLGRRTVGPHGRRHSVTWPTFEPVWGKS